jgi:pyruvate-formate lyase-activating enzyme
MSPWYNICIWSSGKAAPCDPFQDQFSVDQYDTWFQSGDIPTQVRTAMQQGNPVDSCRRCYDAESKNIISFRERFNIQAGVHQGQWFNESLEQSPAWSRMQSINLTPKQKPMFISVTFDNECQSACRMCQPQYSSTVADLWKTLGIDQYEKTAVGFDFNAPSRQRWDLDNKKYKSLTNLVFNNPDLIYLKIGGGEPFSQQAVRQFIQDCIDNNATNVALYITTNGTVYDESFINLLKKFKNVMIDLSIEGFHPTNDYIRIGSSYKQVRENILKFCEHRSPQFEVKIHTLPQLLSVEHYDTAIDFCLEYNLPLYGNPLFKPRHFMMELLPYHHKQRLKKKFTDLYNLVDTTNLSAVQQVNFNSPELNKKTNGTTPTITNQLIKMIHALDSEDQPEYEQYRKDFVHYTKLYDQHFNVNFVEYYPELEDFYNEYSNHRI